MTDTNMESMRSNVVVGPYGKITDGTWINPLPVARLFTCDCKKFFVVLVLVKQGRPRAIWWPG
jgi:hypothetical protein